MNKYELAAQFEDQLPRLHKDLRHLSVLGNAYESINTLTNYTRKMIVTHHFQQVARCMKVAADIHDRGNAVVKNAVENIFVFSFSSMRASCNKVEWRIIQSLIPTSLFLIYTKQVSSTAS